MTQGEPLVVFVLALHQSQVYLQPNRVYTFVSLNDCPKAKQNALSGLAIGQNVQSQKWEGKYKAETFG